MSETITIEINNWKKYQTRTHDLKKPYWFAFANSFFESPEIIDLTNAEKLGFIYILCLASKTRNSEVKIRFSHAEKIGGVKRNEILSLIEKGLENELFVGCRPGAGRVPACTRQDTTRQDTHKATESPNVASDCLFQLWNEYRGNLPAAKAFTQKRKKAARARFDERPDKGYWIEVIKRLSKSSFCNGGGSSGWIASFDFLLRPDTHVKASEGVYDNKGGSSMNSKIGKVEV